MFAKFYRHQLGRSAWVKASAQRDQKKIQTSTSEGKGRQGKRFEARLD